MEHLLGKLQENAGGNIYPYHMPGHKRRGCGLFPENIFKLDITEIDGFDNLHRPEGILMELQKEASRLYGADESFYLVNGSTCGILSAVSCALPLGGHILMARNCHKSVYHAAYLRRLAISYLYPPYLEDYDIFDAVAPRQVETALEQNPDTGAVIVVSPTYEGRIADIGAIAEIVHKRGIPLIVDEAHGAHLGLARDLPRNSCQLGADLVIHSVHKTLPSMTQTALLHVNGSIIDRELLKRFLQIYQSSSPSYVLMASIDNALQYVESDGEEAFNRFRRFFGDMAAKLAECRHLRFLPDYPAFGRGGSASGEERQDVGKLLISVKGIEMTGKKLHDILLRKYRLQTEMTAESFVLAMFTVNDGEEAYCRMTAALTEIDKGLEENGSVWRAGFGEEGSLTFGRRESYHRRPQPEDIPLSAAWDLETELVALEEAAGRHAGEFVNLYPPGVPLLVPGERITRELCGRIRRFMEEGLTLQGVRTETAEIPVIRQTANNMQ